MFSRIFFLDRGFSIFRHFVCLLRFPGIFSEQRFFNFSTFCLFSAFSRIFFETQVFQFFLHFDLNSVISVGKQFLHVFERTPQVEVEINLTRYARKSGCQNLKS